MIAPYLIKVIAPYLMPLGDLKLSGGMYLLQLRQGEVVKTVKVVRK